MAYEKTETMYNGDWNAWESVMIVPIGKAKPLLLIFPAIQRAGDEHKNVPRFERPVNLANARAAVERAPSKTAKKWDEAN